MSEIKEEVSLEEKEFLAARTKYYKDQGADDIGAAFQAGADWKAEEERISKTDEAVWDKFAQKAGLDGIVEDQIRRGLAAFKTQYHKHTPEQTLDFKMYYKNVRSNGGVIAEVHLVLEICRNGLWKVWRQKGIKFQHVREMRDGHKWKLQLQEAMLQDLLSWGVQYCMIIDDVKTGTIKAPQPETTPEPKPTEPNANTPTDESNPA